MAAGPSGVDRVPRMVAVYLVMTLGVAAATAYLWASRLRHIDGPAVTRLREEADRVG